MGITNTEKFTDTLKNPNTHTHTHIAGVIYWGAVKKIMLIEIYPILTGPIWAVPDDEELNPPPLSDCTKCLI